MARAGCEHCDGTGFVVDERDVATRCDCERPEPSTDDLASLGVPRRYLHCTLGSYEPSTDKQVQGLERATRFVEDYPAVQAGLLFTGTVGTGKTHLAVSVLRALFLEKGVRGVFADYHDLLKRIQATFSRSRPDALREEDVLRPVLDAELLVLDDLGARRTTEWAEDTVGHLLNVRYNEQRLTLVTTNLADVDPEQRSRGIQLPGGMVALSDRLQERTVSRLHEMCREVHLDGLDHRRASRRRTGRLTPAGETSRS